MPTFDGEMTNTRYIVLKKELTQWFLRVTLLITLFTVSGYAGNAQSRQQEATKTELIISNNHKTDKRTLSYKFCCQLTRCRGILIRPYKSWINTLFTYEILTKVKFKSISKRFCSHRPASWFLLVKTPKSTDEDIFVNL